MRKYDDLLAMAAEKKGSFGAVLDDIDPSKSQDALASIPDDRWLSMMTKCVFRAGFSWKVIERKWEGFEAAFDGFSVDRCAMMDDAWLDELVSDTRIVRNGQKIQSVQGNAAFVQARSAEAGSFGKFVADWPASDHIGLIDALKKEGSRLGGTTGQYFLRIMGKDSFILTRDVVARLVAEGIVDKAPTSKRAMADVQEAFNTWRDQSGESFNVISRVLAQTIG